MIKFIKLIFILLIISLKDLSSQALSVSPILEEIKLRRGESKIVNVYVFNRSNKDVEIKLALKDMILTPQGVPDYIEPGRYKYGLSKYMALPTRDVIKIPKMMGVRVPVSIKLPKGLREGSLYGAVITELAKPQRKEQEEEKKPLVEVGLSFVSAFIVEVEGVRVSASPRLHHLHVERIGKTNNYSFAAFVINEGHIHAKNIQGEAHVATQIGHVVKKLKLAAGKGYIFPQSGRYITADSQVYLSPGVYYIDTRIIHQEKRYRRYLAGKMYFEITKEGEVNYDVKLKTPKTYLSLSIEPNIIEVSLPKGRKKNTLVKINNYSDIGVDVSLEVEDFILSKYGEIIPQESNELSASKYVSINEKSFHLGANRSKNVLLLCGFGEDDVSGERFSLLRCYARSGELLQSFDAKLILQREGKLEYKAETTQIKVIPQLVDKERNLYLLSIEGIISNKGNAHLLIDKFDLTVIDVKEGKKWLDEEIPVKEMLILPQGEHTFSAQVNLPELVVGEYKAIISIPYRTGKEPILNTVIFKIE